MTHREQFEAMLDEAGIRYSVTGGAWILVGECRFMFGVNGALKELKCEAEYDDDY